MQLRPDQLSVKSDVRAAYKQHRRVLLRCATGWGKTAVASDMIRDADSKGKGSLFVAPLQEIAIDTHKRLKTLGVHASLCYDGVMKSAGNSGVVIGLPETILSLVMPAPYKFGFVVFDEAHHTLANNWLVIAEHYQCPQLLLTATPQRADGSGLGSVADAIVSGPSEQECTDMGLLAPIRVVVPPSTPHPKTLPCTAYDAWKRWGSGPAIVFCEDVQHAIHEALKWPDGRAHVLSSDCGKEERANARRWIHESKIDALCVVGIGIEGFDCPPLATTIVSRNVGHVGPYLQMIGRARRLWDGKETATLIDLKGNAYLHGMPNDDRVWTLDGKARRKNTSASYTRCPECFAVFPPRAKCPECGSVTSRKHELPRYLNDAEKLALCEHIPHTQQWDNYYKRMLYRAINVLRLTNKRAAEWAEKQTVKYKGDRNGSKT